jgi:coenzyme Q-binding protein COQ10
MPSFSTKRRVPFTAAQMYALVADVERYPEFLPMCTGLTVSSRKSMPDGEDLVARMSVGYKTISESFMTSVRLRPAVMKVEANYLDGPFKRLENRWQFTDAPTSDGPTAQGPTSDSHGGCDVNFFIDYEFKSAMLGLLVGQVFDQAFRKFTEAFEQRARQVYGTQVTARS